MKFFYIITVLVITLLFTGTTTASGAVVNPELQQKLAAFPLPDDIAGKPSRFGYLRKLLGISSGAKQVMKSANVEAHDAYIKARKIYIQAATESDNDKVNKLLDQAVKQMYQAIRLASPKSLVDRKKKRDYKRRQLSVNALLEALQRIAIEKDNQDETDKIRDYVRELTSSADKLAGKKDFDKAREQLDEAYLLIKTGIENMRRGDVLVRELSFESIEEEYAYELDRNDTHQMLIKLLIEKKLATKPAAFKKRIQDRVAKAKDYRQQAEHMAADSDFEQAISELEKSTKELVRAIRMGGVFIPG
ncbi:hypothetical protein A9Q98_08515 [Thalassotalea sp. 42_200_T64]|nr:hypothetical protein A9Q98_08515 [Thalassotalea sp. 42_200_T64]